MERSIILLFATVALLFSCDKKADNINVPDEHVKQVAKWEAAANSENPYESDSIGAWHNIGLDYLIERVDSFTSSNAWFDSIPFLTYDLLGGSNNLDENYWRMVEETWPSDVASINLSYLEPDSMLEQFSSTIDPYYEDLVGAITSSTSPSDLHGNMVSWESTVNSSISLGTSEKELLLICASVARYSMYYWYEELITSPGAWFVEINKVNEDLDLEDVIAVVMVDLNAALDEYDNSGDRYKAIASGLQASSNEALKRSSGG